MYLISSIMITIENDQRQRKVLSFGGIDKLVVEDT
jgi:hypothetical protein